MSGEREASAHSRPSRAARAVLWLARKTNWMAKPLAGRRWLPLWGIVHTRGRRSGRTYSIPVALRVTPDAFFISVPWEGAQWYRNVLAADGCVLRWKGADNHLSGAELVDASVGLPAFNVVQRALLRAGGIDKFLRLSRPASHADD
ncbi:MAG: hypothetical protein ACRDGJ_00590 [Candidatus Limnocylindria bacterium]